MRLRSLAAALALALVAVPAGAQVPGLPVFNSGPKPGLTVGLDAGFPDEDAGGGNAFAGTVMELLAREPADFPRSRAKDVDVKECCYAIDTPD